MCCTNPRVKVRLRCLGILTILSTASSSIKHCPTPVIYCSFNSPSLLSLQIKATYPSNLSKLPTKTKTMKFTLFTTLLISAASARQFTLFDNANYGGASHTENRNNDNTCWNLNGKGDRASSVRGAGQASSGSNGCTTFFRYVLHPPTSSPSRCPLWPCRCRELVRC